MFTFLFLGRQTPPPTVEKSRTTRQRLCGVEGSGSRLPVMSASGPVPSSVSPAQPEPLASASGSALPSMSIGSDPSKTLSLTFNGRTFYMLSDVIAHICDYPEGEERVALYVDVVKQVEKIFDLGSAFAEGLIKAIKKDKSWALAEWSTNKVEQLLVPLSRHVRAARVGRTRRQGALTTINRHWGPEVTAYFRSRNESEKTLRQLSHLSRNSFSYPEARRLVNARVVERILTGRSCHYSRYDTTTSDWAALDKGKHDPDVSFARLAAANLHYGEFGELLEGPLPSPQVSDGTGHSSVSSHYGRYGQLMEGPPPVTTRKDVEEGVDVDGDDDDGGHGQDGDEGDVNDGDESDGQDGDGEDGQDDDGGVAHDGDREDNQDGNGGDAPDVDPMQSVEAENAKSTSSIIGRMVEAENGVGHTTSTLPVDVTSVNILEDVLANPFGAFDTDHTIAFDSETPAVPAVGITLATPSINPDTLFEEWSLCTSCSLNVVSAEPWRKQICNCRDRGFLDGMYMLGCVKHMLFNVCDRHLHLLALNLHLVDASPAELRSRIDSIWEHRDRTSALTSFVYDHPVWFLNTLRFI